MDSSLFDVRNLSWLALSLSHLKVAVVDTLLRSNVISQSLKDGRLIFHLLRNGYQLPGPLHWMQRIICIKIRSVNFFHAVCMHPPSPSPLLILSPQLIENAAPNTIQSVTVTQPHLPSTANKSLAAIQKGNHSDRSVSFKLNKTDGSEWIKKSIVVQTGVKK